jgi:hypothetical protein
MKCQMCFERTADRWVLVDNDYEVELCDPCISDLNKANVPTKELTT